MKMVQRTLYGQGNAYNLELGFIPTYVEIFKQHDTVTSASVLKWWGKEYEDDAVVDAADQEYGVIITNGTQSEGTANTGISSYDGAKTPQVLVESPIPAKGDLKRDCFSFAYHKAKSTNPTARSATVIGTMLRPTIANGYVYECTTKVGAMTALTEPTWPKTPGETITDGSNTWTCREENIVANKGLGITLGSSLASAGVPLFITAYEADQYTDLGTVP